ncbi:MAG: YceI family protein [Oligoflexia bacterium]|nr:YceI family protein [Oligoflexia bacterium]MBF0366657.1 YceI family protein [Oligoflexia bacterium]
MKSLNIFLVLSFFFFTLSTLEALKAAEERFNLTPPGDSNPNQIKFTLGYSLGTHVGKVYAGTGFVTLEAGQLETLRGEFHIPIAAIRTGNDATRDCHLRESLGLNYQLADYPARHICDSNDMLPETGGASIKYPWIHFTIDKSVLLSSESDFATTRKAQIRIFGTWEMHGQKFSSDYPFSVEFSQDGSSFTTKGDLVLNFDDFGIQVKPVRVFGFSLSVDEMIKLKLNLLMKKVGN